MKNCGYCAAYLPDSATRCACGRILLTVNINPETAKRTNLCEHCKMSVPHDARTCGHCGKDLGAIPVVVAIIQLLIAAAGIYFAWQWWSDYSAVASNLAK